MPDAVDHWISAEYPGTQERNRTSFYLSVYTPERTPDGGGCIAIVNGEREYKYEQGRGHGSTKQPFVGTAPRLYHAMTNLETKDTR